MRVRAPALTRLLLAFSILLALISPAVAADTAPSTATAGAPATKCPGLPPPSVLASKIEGAPDLTAFLGIFHMETGGRPSAEWTCFLDKVERGDATLGPALGAMSKKPYWLAEPGVAEAMSRALPLRPTTVLKAIAASPNPHRSTELICRIDPPYGTSRKDAEATHKKIYKALGGVWEEGLAGTRHACFESLARHFREWKDLRQLAGDTPNE